MFIAILDMKLLTLAQFPVVVVLVDTIAAFLACLLAHLLFLMCHFLLRLTLISLKSLAKWTLQVSSAGASERPAPWAQSMPAPQSTLPLAVRFLPINLTACAMMFLAKTFSIGLNPSTILLIPSITAWFFKCPLTS